LQNVCILQRELRAGKRGGAPVSAARPRAPPGVIAYHAETPVAVTAPDNPWTRLAVVAAWAIAFALVEAMVVVYLRRLFSLQYDLTFVPRDFHFPRAYLGYEQAREAATMVMLLGVGFLAGRTWGQRFAYWLFAFGVWDIFYYAWLWAYLGWPSSPRTRDLLFLIPAEWWAPVWHPVLASLCFIGVALLILARTRRT
jgi:hypothetical protein